MTVQSLINEIARKTVGSADNVDTDFTNIALDGIKSALRRVPRFARFKALTLSTTKTLTAGDQSIDISDLTSFVEIKRIYYIDSGERYKITKRERGIFNEVYSTTNTGKPQYYSNKDDDTIEFDRKNDETRTLYIEYYGSSSSITTSSTISLRDDIIEILKDGALAYVWDHLEDDVKARSHKEDFIIGIQKLEIDSNREEQPDYITETDD